MKRMYFDLETAALPVEQLTGIMPEFEAAANLKDPDKIAASIASKKQSWIDDCALRATTGRIIAASSCDGVGNEPEFHCSPDERTMLDILFSDMCDTITQGGHIYAWNLFGFDLPFLAQRSAMYGVPAFKTFMANYRGRWAWHEAFVDPMQIWAGPYQRSDGASLKAVAGALGLGIKSGSGKDFAKLLVADPVAAKEYSLNDVRLLRGIVDRMGI